MPSYTDMLGILRARMTDVDGKTDLTTDLSGRTIAIWEDPYFKDWANLGAMLSHSANRPAILTALQTLDEAMASEITGTWKYFSAKNAAISHFRSSTYFEGDYYRKLLSKSLAKFESAHGFVVPERLPTFAGFVFGNVFKDTIKSRMHFKDVGAGPSHGEYTHRIQWYVAIKAGGLISVDKSEAGQVYGAIHRWLNKRQPGKGGKLLQLWNYLFDMQKPLVAEPDTLEDSDFRSPENFHAWLTSDAGEKVCPLLSAFLSNRKLKRQGSYQIESYFKKKLGTEQGTLAYKAFQELKRKFPSARIVFDDKGKGSYQPFVT